MDVTTAAGGQEAIQLLQQASDADKPFNLVLMDWQMPGLDGIEATRLIKADPRIPKTPTVFMVTAFGREEVMTQAEQLDIQAFLIKPVGPSMLLDTIASVFGGQSPALKPIAAGISGKATALAAHARGAHVLLAEDNKINQQVAEELLTGFGVVVDIVSNGRLAVDAVSAEAHRYAAVLMDIQMPEMDGLEATREIRKLPGARHLPIIAMTAHAMDAERQRCFDAGMDDHLSKPIDPERLVGALNHWIKPGSVTEPLPVAPAAETAVDDTVLPDDLPPFDIKAALVRVNGKRRLLKRLMLGFAETYADAGSELRRLVGTGALAEAGRLAHTMRGVAGSLEARALFEATKDLEALCAQGGPQDFAPLLAAIDTHLAAALAAVGTLETPVPVIVAKGPARAVDFAAVRAAIDDLKPLLDRKSLSARKRFQALRGLLEGGSFDAELAAIGKALDALDFTATQAPLDMIHSKLTEETTV
jgi:CheY-like chemotaxis protein